MHAYVWKPEPEAAHAARSLHAPNTLADPTVSSVSILPRTNPAGEATARNKTVERSAAGKRPPPSPPTSPARSLTASSFYRPHGRKSK